MHGYPTASRGLPGSWRVARRGRIQGEKEERESVKQTIAWPVTEQTFELGILHLIITFISFFFFRSGIFYFLFCTKSFSCFGDSNRYKGGAWNGRTGILFRPLPTIPTVNTPATATPLAILATLATTTTWQLLHIYSFLSFTCLTTTTITMDPVKTTAVQPEKKDHTANHNIIESYQRRWEQLMEDTEKQLQKIRGSLTSELSYAGRC